MLIEEHFDQLIKYLYNFKVVVGASTVARHTLTSKGLSPAMFLRPFFKANGRTGDFNLIDVEDFCQPADRAYNDRTKEMLASCVVSSKVQESFKTRSDVEDHINNQGFMWFLDASKLYLDSTSFDFEVTTIDQPIAVVHVMSVEDEDFSREYFKVIEATNALLKFAYKLNPDQYLKLEPMVVILIDRSKGRAIQQALRYSQHLRKEHKVRGNLICRVEVNTNESQDYTIWSSFRRNSYFYKLNPKDSELVRLMSKQNFDKLMTSAGEYQAVVKEGISKRVDYLNKQFKEFSKVANKFIVGFFGGGGGDRDKYSREEVECRELADINFIQGDYRRAFECYKELLGKFQTRNRRIHVSLLEMISHCYVYSKIQGLGIKGDPYSHIQKQAKNILDHSSYFLKYSIFLVASLHVLRVFKKQLVKQVFYARLKQFLRNNPPVMGFLLQQQYATFYLCFTPIQYHNYASTMLKVGVHFNDAKLINNAQRSFLIVQSIYRNTFSPIEVFVQTYLGKLCLETGNYLNSVNYIRKGWNSLSKKINDDKYNQFVKNCQKIITCLDDVGAGLFLEKDGQHIRFPVVAAIDLTTQDEYSTEKLPRLNSYNSKPVDIPLSETWAGMGSQFFGNDNISRNTYAPEYRKLDGFDAPTIQQKYLANRFKTMAMNDKVIEKNARVCFVKEKIRVQVWFNNPINQDLEITRCSLIFGKSQPEDYQCEPANQVIRFKPNQQRVAQFTVTPLRPGLLELTHVTWNINRLHDYHLIPAYNKDSYRNLYYQFNVKQQTGVLKITPAMPATSLFVGAVQTINIELHNEGTQPIQEITVIASDPRMFGFRNRKLPGIGAGDKGKFDVTLRVYDEKCNHLKLLFIYKTKDNVRMKRLSVGFTPEPVILVKDIKCEKISSHIHMLVFEVSKISDTALNKTVDLLNDNQGTLELEQLILGEGFKILKFELAKSRDRAVYTFFLQKNPTAKGEMYKFIGTNVNIDDYKSYIEADEEVRRAEWALCQNKYYPYDHVDRMNIILLFRHNGRLGMYHPYKVATNPKLLKILDKKGKIQDYLLPFNFKIKYPAVVEHNFMKEPCLSIPIEVALKNIFTESTMNLLVQFYEEQQALGFWQGITFKEVKLQRDEEVVFHVKFVVTEPGIYDLSSIKYTLLKDKNKAPAVIVHSMYQKLFLEVTNQKSFSKPTVTKTQPQGNIQTDLLA